MIKINLINTKWQQAQIDKKSSKLDMSKIHPYDVTAFYFCNLDKEDNNELP